MSQSYFLKQGSYSIKNSMLWGNCTSHFKEIKSRNTDLPENRRMSFLSPKESFKRDSEGWKTWLTLETFIQKISSQHQKLKTKYQTPITKK